MRAHDLVQRALATGWGSLPAEARHAARLSLADGLAVMLAAVALEPACAAFANHVRGAGAATLLAGGRATPAGAALANGALAHALDFEDTFDAAGLHPNAAAIPALMALGESEGASFGEMLTALAVAADFTCRLGLALPADPARRGWYHPPMIGAAGATLGAAHLLRLTPDQAVAALSLAGVQFALTDALKAAPDSHLRAVRDGFAARAAVEAALLARRGVIGTREPVEAPFTLLAGAPPRAEAFDGLGARFLGAEVTLKSWPCCRGTHRAIALGLELRAAGVAPEDIAAAAFTVAPPDDMLFTPLADRQRPTTAIAAKFSIPFTFASALVHGAPGLRAFDDAARRDDALRALAVRVTMARCVEDRAPMVELDLRDGRQIRRELPEAPRRVAGGTSFNAVAGKFADCLSAAARPELVRHLLSLDTVPPETPVVSVLAPFGRSG